MSTKIWYFASCPKGLESELEQEAKEQGIDEYILKNGGILFSLKDLSRSIKFLLSTRIASRMYREVYIFTIETVEDLYGKSLEKKWENIFEIDQTFKIETLFDLKAKEKFSNSIYISLKLKDAIADHFHARYKSRPSVDLENPDIRFLLRIEREHPEEKSFKASILMDLTGKDALCHRGYRSDRHSAPLRENLAAGIILKTNWNDERDLFIDPMCGGGTLLIEALLMKGKIVPTYLKLKKIVEEKTCVFSFEKQLWFRGEERFRKDFYDLCRKMWKTVCKNLELLPKDQFYGSDISSRSLEITKFNLHSALMSSDLVELQMISATKLFALNRSPGVIVCNPPYGNRMGDHEQLKKLYYDFGENLKKNYKGFTAYIFTSSSELRGEISLQTSQRVILYNGSLECRLLKYRLY